MKEKSKIKKNGRRKGPGRPTKLNILTIKKICALIEQGITRTQAYGSLGISQSCFLGWIAQARSKSNWDCEELLRDVEKAEACYNVLLEKKLHEHTFDNDDRDLLKWQLPKRNRQTWGETNEPVVHLNLDGHKIKVDDTIDYISRIRKGINPDEQRDSGTD